MADNLENYPNHGLGRALANCLSDLFNPVLSGGFLLVNIESRLRRSESPKKTQGWKQPSVRESLRISQIITILRRLKVVRLRRRLLRLCRKWSETLPKSENCLRRK